MIVKPIDKQGVEHEFYLDENLAKNLDTIKDSVCKKGWDYVCIIAGIPGVGKSTFAQQLAKYLDPDFEIDNICFDATDFCERTSQAKEKGRAFILDESFADMNSNVGRSEDFVKIMNHIQLIRQKNLFLILVLPDFFSLSKNIAIFRASHLFVAYHDNYERGRFAAFDREKKKELYVKGKPFINYQIVSPNFRGKFVKKWLVDFDEYERRKMEHLISQAHTKEKVGKASIQRDVFMAYMKEILGVSSEKMAEMSNMPLRTVNKCLERSRDSILSKYKDERK